MRTELAQVYSNLGQPQKSIALLCGKKVDKFTDSQNQNIKTVDFLASFQ